MQTQISFEILSSLVALIGSYFAYREFKKNKNLNAIDKFIAYREKLKKDESLIKIVKHIQIWQNDPNLKSQIPADISVFDFYNFLGFFEEIQILMDNGHIDKTLAKDMFSFYGCQLANNEHYWSKFNEDFKNDEDWKKFKLFVETMS